MQAANKTLSNSKVTKEENDLFKKMGDLKERMN